MASIETLIEALHCEKSRRDLPPITQLFVDAFIQACAECDSKRDAISFQELVVVNFMILASRSHLDKESVNEIVQKIRIEDEPKKWDFDFLRSQVSTLK